MKGVPSTFWSQSKTRTEFLKLCKNSVRIAVDWDKFRENDAEGKFSHLKNTDLSIKYRTLKLKAKGLCYQCGKHQAETKNGLCRVCKDWFKAQKSC